jgi:hypothetical protein
VQQLNSRNIFFVDGVGAIASLMPTGFVLPVFSSFIGLPTKELYALASLPLAFSVYLFTCFGWVSRIRPWMLVSIIVANICCGVVSGALIFFHHGRTNCVRTLLVSEIVDVPAVAVLELKVYRTHFAG